MSSHWQHDLKSRKRLNNKAAKPLARSPSISLCIGIAIISALISPRLSFAQSGNSDGVYCVQAEVCVTFPAPIQLRPITSNTPANVTIFARKNSAGTEDEKKDSQYLLQVIQIEETLNQQRLWLDLVQRIKQQHSRVSVRPQRPKRYQIKTMTDSEGSYQLISWQEDGVKHQALYHLLNVKERQYWLIATAVAPDTIESFSQELIQSLSQITSLGNRNR
ncbi:hypothetical protein [Gilvimarinus agarilyticus]|uniref:hypothetical protein n=1 Tax=Gilvimarinus agarilyticus TaxID=679259 RepID=UPI0005A026D1|nr:hypothetical protein [Gilvimarinus agarilyticus]